MRVHAIRKKVEVVASCTTTFRVVCFFHHAARSQPSLVFSLHSMMKCVHIMTVKSVPPLCAVISCQVQSVSKRFVFCLLSTVLIL